MNHDRSINPGFRFPYEMWIRFRWQVAATGGRWRGGACGPYVRGCDVIASLPDVGL
jgi:hypothetical protein